MLPELAKLLTLLHKEPWNTILFEREGGGSCFLGLVDRKLLFELSVLKNIFIQRKSNISGVRTYSECREVLRLAKQYLGEVLSAFELMDSEAMRCLLENEKLHNVLTSNPPFNLLIEVMGLCIHYIIYYQILQLYLIAFLCVFINWSL